MGILALRESAVIKQKNAAEEKSQEMHGKKILEEESKTTEETDSVKEEKPVQKELNLKPFDYETWNKEIHEMFKEQEEKEREMLAKDKMYIDNLKQKINEKIKSELEKKKSHES